MKIKETNLVWGTDRLHEKSGAKRVQGGENRC